MVGVVVGGGRRRCRLWEEVVGRSSNRRRTATGGTEGEEKAEGTEGTENSSIIIAPWTLSLEHRPWPVCTKHTHPAGPRTSRSLLSLQPSRKNFLQFFLHSSSRSSFLLFLSFLPFLFFISIPSPSSPSALMRSHSINTSTLLTTHIIRFQHFQHFQCFQCVQGPLLTLGFAQSTT